MALNVLDRDGLPPAGIERRLAHHLLGRPNPLAKQVVYSLFGSPRRNGELVRLVGGKSETNLTQVLRLLQEEGIVGTVVDARTRPTAVAYILTTFGYLVLDWMRRYEWVEEMRADKSALASPASS